MIAMVTSLQSCLGDNDIINAILIGFGNLPFNSIPILARVFSLSKISNSPLQIFPSSAIFMLGITRKDCVLSLLLVSFFTAEYVQGTLFFAHLTHGRAPSHFNLDLPKRKKKKKKREATCQSILGKCVEEKERGNRSVMRMT